MDAMAADDRPSRSKTWPRSSLFDELHDVVELTFVLAHAEDRHDVGVMQLGRGCASRRNRSTAVVGAWCAIRTFTAARRPRASSIAS